VRQLSGRVPRVGRGLGFTGFVVAGLCFLLPFVTVSCEAPGGYGRAGAGATTNYTGLDLATGASPSVDGGLRPAAQRRPDDLPAQPAAMLALAAVAAGAAVVALVGAVRVRRLSAAGTAFAAACLVGIAVAGANALVESRLREQLTVPMPTNRMAGDFVATGRGAWLCLGLLGVLFAVNLAGWWRARKPVPGPRKKRARPA
jgi:hypothetical protein